MMETGNFGKIDPIVDQMNKLKNKVYGMLRKYAFLFEEQPDYWMIQKQIREDCNKIKNEYGNISYKSNHPAYQRLSQISNFVQEFTTLDTNFDYQKQSSVGSRIKNGIGQSHIRQNTENQSTQYQKSEQDVDGFNDKGLQRIQQKLEFILQQDQMYHSKTILLKIMEDLNQVTDENNQELVRNILEKGIDELEKTKDSVKLYNNLEQLIYECKQKNSKQRNSSPFSTKQRKHKIFDQEQLKRSEQKMENLTKCKQEESDKKRKFFDIALIKKYSSGNKSKGQNMMISEMYKQFCEQRNDSMVEFINECFQK